MTNRPIGKGGFFLPKIYHKAQRYILDRLKDGEVDYLDLTKWSFADEFLCFILQLKFFDFADKSYPNPRKVNFVPVWFLIAAQFVLRLHNRRCYDDLRYFLNAGSILTKIGFNASAGGVVGFNEKNKYERQTAIDADTVRKYYKDTNSQELRDWYNESVQGWFRSRKVFDRDGLFILDQSHLVVPDNPCYEGAVRMPVDEHGQRYRGLNKMSEEERKALVHHPCYTLSCLLHVSASGDLYHIAGYDFGSGNTDELVQAENLLPAFCKMYPGVMKELILDRGYISGPFIGKMKQKYNVDVLIPLKSSMSDFQDALKIAQTQNWTTTENEIDKTNGRLLRKTITTCVKQMELWQECPIPLDTYVSETTRWSSSKQAYETYNWVLAASKSYTSEAVAIARYSLRTQVEERFRQLKCFWNIADFPSPAPGLMEAQICFISLTYSLLQLYLRRDDLRDLTHRAIDTIRTKERLGTDSVLVYAEDSYGVYNLDDYSLTIMDLDPEPKGKLKGTFEKQKEVRISREDPRQRLR
jgi:hypothetical protein